MINVVRVNKTKQALKAGKPTVGAIVASPAPELVEIAAVAGFDFVTFDAEHEPLDDAQLVDLIRAADAFDITPIVRVPKDPDRLLRLLDAGAQGVHVPRCSSVEDIRQLVECTRFHPLGRRTFYRLGRGGNFSHGLSDDEWSRQANDELLVIAMIEEAQALPQLDAMLAVDGIDAIHIGPKDLWQSMGMPPKAQVDQAIQQIAAAVLRSGKKLSMQFAAIEELGPQIAAHRARGVTMTGVPLLGLLLKESSALLRTLRGSG
ncbi:MAG: siderophore biosynthesis protein SbnG [Burkholderiales bacterium]|nr:siderophore biosynthesis protein SbnG [Burkholderiales bacterium]